MIAWNGDECLKWGTVLPDRALIREELVPSTPKWCRQCQRGTPPDVDGVCRESDVVLGHTMSEEDTPPHVDGVHRDPMSRADRWCRWCQRGTPPTDVAGVCTGSDAVLGYTVSDLS